MRLAAAVALGQIRNARAVWPLIGALKDNQSYVRKAALDALLMIGAPAVEPLVASLTDSSSIVRRGVADALEKMRWRPTPDESGAAYWISVNKLEKCAEIGAPAIGPLIAELTGGSTGKAAAGALVKIGKPAVEPLIAALQDNDNHGCSDIADALGQIGGARAVISLIVALEDRDKPVRLAAVEALKKIGDSSAVEPLTVALRDNDSEVRLASAEALKKTGNSRAIEPLIVALKNGELPLRLAAICALGQIGAVSAIELFVAALKDRFPSVRKAAAQALDATGWRPDPDEIGAVYWVVKGDWDKCIGIGAPAVEILIAALGDRGLDELGLAAYALGEIGDTRAIKPLIAALTCGTWSVRQASAEALVGLYRSGRLDENCKPLILSQRGNISTDHNDKSTHDDSYSCGFHADANNHIDKGIGVPFSI